MEVGEDAYVVTQGKNRARAKKKRKGKIALQEEIKKESKYFFCKKKRYMKKDCLKFHK